MLTACAVAVCCSEKNSTQTVRRQVKTYSLEVRIEVRVAIHSVGLKSLMGLYSFFTLTDSYGNLLLPSISGLWEYTINVA